MDKIWTVQEILNWTIQFFKTKNIIDARLSAELLLAEVLGCRRIELYLQFERILTMEERDRFREMVRRRAKHEPVQYILGHTEFMGLPIRVTPAVLIPRPETEVLTDSVIEFARTLSHPPTILDVGTGSGCIAIALAKLLPEAQVWAMDRSSDAIALARENATLNGVEVQFVEGDFFEKYTQLQHHFNIIVSNPPYIAGKDWETVPEEVKRYEPRLALDGGEDGLRFYHHLAEVVQEILDQHGRIFLEVGFDQARKVVSIFKNFHFHSQIKKDLQGIERIVILSKDPLVNEINN
ncbi:MAG: peptide chain release factor N(5)-glutamine methyltransferase [Calditrichaeota bacterium]|nr:MAG: peptide chain release factor N(5)-glutamine methyltransferase [Calditrichota bacterium]